MKTLYTIFVIIVLCIACTSKKTDEIDYSSYLYNSTPMPMDTSKSLQYLWDHKKIYDSCVVDNMESLENWKMSTEIGKENVATICLSKEHVFEGKYAIKFKAPTKLKRLLKQNDERFWEWQYLTREFKNQDFTKYNRVSIRIFPDFKGHQKLHLLIILNNDGNVPDKYFRDGIHMVMLKNHQWNKVVMEIPHLPRNQVNGISLVYRLQGNEKDAADTIVYYADQLSFEKVEADYYEGWGTNGAISFSHSGYNTNSKKTAFTSFKGYPSFKVIDVANNKTVLEKPAKKQSNSIGDYAVFDFSELNTAGNYKIVYDDVETRPFPIKKDVWLPSILKTINLFFTERCGYNIPGIHNVCHSDWYTVYKGDTVALNGGWHDAGDLSQGYLNTSEAVYILFKLGRKFKKNNPELSERLINEAKWGLKWLHNNRFENGQRVYWTTIDSWSDGKIGNFDDIVANRSESWPDMYYSINAEVEAAKEFEKSDIPMAALCKQHAIKDWGFLEKQNNKDNLEILSLAVSSGVKVFELIGDMRIKKKVIEYANQIMSYQQQEPMNWKIPLSGFFYKDKSAGDFFGYSHHVIVASPIAGIVDLCKLFPHDPNYSTWIKSIELYANYLKNTAQLTAPYYLVPARLYKLGSDEDIQIKQGIKMDDQYYLRIFPVWTQFRGNSSIVLSQGIGLACANQILNDPEIKSICEAQLQWMVGRNPFCQSLMYGEGYDFAPQYSAACGDIVGGIATGIQTHGDNDIPYWQATIFPNYKEIWVQPSTKWLELLELLDPL